MCSASFFSDTKQAKMLIKKWFYTNSNVYKYIINSDFINDPISGENRKSSSIDRRKFKGRMKVVCH